ncbi:MAG TPA: rubrerythrin family protein [Phaeodactylibacter sp.]|nr:rubrerythrin family protein [Phaeodactylibacter sp.]
MKDIAQKIFRQQQNEITEYHTYLELSRMAKDEHNRKTLERIAEQERGHYQFWKKITGKDAEPKQRKIRWHILLAKIFGLSFSLRLLERGEAQAQAFYESVTDVYPEAEAIREDEMKHEQELIEILNDERLKYAGAIVLGLNDALVEFTGTLAGLTFAFGNNLIVGTTGLVMGVAASLSMAASGYLASREDDYGETNPITSAIYTGVAYLLTVAFLVFPYLIQSDPYIALGGMLLTTILIIAGYTFYISVAKNISFSRRFWEMALISMGVAAISFGIGTLVKIVFGVEV